MNIYNNQILYGNNLEILKSIPDKSVDLVFADPPYNLQLKNTLHRPNNSLVEAVTENWDKFNSFEAYDKFSMLWLSECKRVLKDKGALWVPTIPSTRNSTALFSSALSEGKVSAIAC